eukprot:1284579-Rhodomonas_salina.3
MICTDAMRCPVPTCAMPLARRCPVLTYAMVLSGVGAAESHGRRDRNLREQRYCTISEKNNLRPSLLAIS